MGSYRLQRNFHKTFKPERQYINSMLRFAAAGRTGDFHTIASSTRIPMGTSSGKVPAILDYCKCMGLIRVPINSVHTAIKKPELTNFGRAVLFEDPFLKCGISQWIAHFNMCSPLYGADVWYQTFFIGAPVFGRKFGRNQLESHLSLVYGIRKNSLIGPLISMYEDEASLKTCGVLSEIEGMIVRREAPIMDEFIRGIGAWLLQLIADHFPKQQQVPISVLDKVAGCRTIPGWTVPIFLTVLELLERKDLIMVDRHMNPWLIQPKKEIDEAWRSIYLDII